MDSSGVVHEDSTDSSNGKKKRGKGKKGKIPEHRKKNNSPYGTFAEKYKSGTPNGAQRGIISTVTKNCFIWLRQQSEKHTITL